MIALCDQLTHTVHSSLITHSSDKHWSIIDDVIGDYEREKEKKRDELDCSINGVKDDEGSGENVIKDPLGERREMGKWSIL